MGFGLIALAIDEEDLALIEAFHYYFVWVWEFACYILAYSLVPTHVFELVDKSIIIKK